MPTSQLVKAGPNWLDRAILAVAPIWGTRRLRARAASSVLARHYEAAAIGRRTTNWPRGSSDANVAAGPALATLRNLARDLVRNNAWARNALRIITRNVVGWGIIPKPVGLASDEQRETIFAAWKRWAETTQCDADGRLTFGGIQKLVMRSVAEAGETLVRRRWRRPEDGLAIPLQLQVLEPDFIDTTQDNRTGMAGGPIVQGVEFDKLGRRAAYWLFPEHPGSNRATGSSRRIPASEILHVYDLERAGQVRAVSWLASAIVKIRDFDEFEDASLMQAKIAALFSAIQTDVDGAGTAIGEPSAADPLVETLEPGMILRLPPGKDVKFGVPPVAPENGFSTRTLRAIAAALGVTYEDLTNDFSQVNFSSARMSRIAHWGNVYDWQWNMLIPQFCDPAWAWAMEVAVVAGLVDRPPSAEWTPQPMPLTDPDKEARANVVRIRSGQATLPQVIREMGGDPDTHLAEIAKANQQLDEMGIWLDSDPRRTSQAGLTQERVGAAGGGDNSASKGDEQGAGQ